MGAYTGIYIISALFMLVGAWVGNRLKKKMEKYAQVPLRSGLTGREIAERMLKDNGITDVKVTGVNGFLTDHYNPMNKTVNLSPMVFQSASVAAAAVAAHEVGHAVQHATAYPFLKFRSAMVPIVRVSGMVSQWVLIGGIVMVQSFPSLLLFGIILFAATTLFTVVTLPVEFDATNRGLAWLETARVTYGEEHEMAKDGLKGAALTYVVAALQSIMTLLYYVWIYMGRRN